MYRYLSYFSPSGELKCISRTTPRWYCFTPVPLQSNIGCPLGPCVPVAMTYLGCPSSLFSGFLSITASTTQNFTPGALPSPHRLHVTLVLPPFNPSMTPRGAPALLPQSTAIPFTWSLCNTCVTNMTSVTANRSKIQ